MYAGGKFGGRERTSHGLSGTVFGMAGRKRREFTALGVQLLLLRRGTAGKDAARAVEYGFFAAFLDESIQILSARGPQIADVWLDTAGTAFGVAVAVLVRMLLRSSNIRRA